MAKAKGSSSSAKVTFGSRRIGKSKKRVGPREKSVKRYRGQGGRR